MLNRIGYLTLVLLVFMGCSQTPPVLKNFLVDFSEWDWEKGDPATLGSFYFDSSEPNVLMTLMGSENNGKIMPDIAFYTAQDAVVMSPIDGVITKVRQKEDEPEGDMSILIKPTKRSVYFVEIDHIKDVEVSKGDTVSAGEIVGKAANYNQKTIGTVELHVVKNDEKLNLCPGDFLDPEVAEEIEKQVNRLMADVEELKSDTNIYDEKQLRGIGCYRTSIPDSELED